MTDVLDQFHPESIARSIEHRRRGRTAPCAADGKDGDVTACTCQPAPALLWECWEGRARMAFARRTAGLSLSAIDLQALDRYPKPQMTGATS